MNRNKKKKKQQQSQPMLWYSYVLTDRQKTRTGSSYELCLIDSLTEQTYMQEFVLARQVAEERGLEEDEPIIKYIRNVIVMEDNSYHSVFCLRKEDGVTYMLCDYPLGWMFAGGGAETEYTFERYWEVGWRPGR